MEGLGAPPAFIDGEDEETVLEVYHRYQLYRQLVGQKVGQQYLGGECQDGCPPGSHCSFGLCFCDAGELVSRVYLDERTRETL